MDSAGGKSVIVDLKDKHNKQLVMENIFRAENVNKQKAMGMHFSACMVNDATRTHTNCLPKLRMPSDNRIKRML